LYNLFYYGKKDCQVEVQVGGSGKNEHTELGLNGYEDNSMEERW